MSKNAPPAPDPAPEEAPEKASDQAPAELLAYIERFASVLTDSGIPRMPSRVFAALLTADAGRLTSQQLAAMLDISPAAVSGAIRYLGQVGLVTRERDPGSRRDRYRVLDEVWQEAILHRDAVLARWETSLAEGVAVVGAQTPAGRRLAESVVMFQFLRGELPGMLKRWYEQRAELRAAAARDKTVGRALAARPEAGSRDATPEAEPGEADSGDAEPGKAEPGDGAAGEAHPGDAEPAHGPHGSEPDADADRPEERDSTAP